VSHGPLAPAANACHLLPDIASVLSSALQSAGGAPAGNHPQASAAADGERRLVQVADLPLGSQTQTGMSAAHEGMLSALTDSVQALINHVAKLQEEQLAMQNQLHFFQQEILALETDRRTASATTTPPLSFSSSAPQGNK
jgi:hypothetical protein